MSVSPTPEVAGAAGEYDFGDAPDNYGTTLAANAAYHEAVGPTLGATRDAESDGLPSIAADGDDADGTDDEDGVTFGTLQVGQLDATVTVNVQNVTTAAYLDAWIDFNGDGSFGGVDELIADSVAVVEGDNMVEFDVPFDAATGETFARFRLSSIGNLDATGPADDGEVEDYVIAIAEPVDLGVVDFLELPDLDLSSGPRAYSFTTKYSGYLDVDAALPSASQTVTLRLHDAMNDWTFTGDSAGDDHASTGAYSLNSGQQYTLLIAGTSTDVDLTICNLVTWTGTTIIVHGTDDADEFEFDFSEVTINGFSYTVQDGVTTSVGFDGGGSEDQALLFGTFYGEATFSPGRGSMTDTRTGFVLSVENVAQIYAIGGGIEDTMSLEDSQGDDTLVASPKLMQLSGTTADGNPYLLSATNFRYAHAYARNGGDDTATLEGSEDYDRIKAYPDFVRLFNSTFYNRVKFFDTVAADTLGGEDYGVMLASDNADVVWAMKDGIRVAQNVELAAEESPDYDALAYNVTIAGCEFFTARADGGDDWLELHDSAGKDVLIAKPHKIMMMNGPTSSVARGEEYTITARGFSHMTSIADQGGDYDAAKLYDSSEDGTDVWAAAYVDGETWSTMTSPSRLLYEVTAFEQVGGYGFNGGLGEDHGTNTKDHAEDVDFVFEYGYWEL